MLVAASEIKPWRTTANIIFSFPRHRHFPLSVALSLTCFRNFTVLEKTEYQLTHKGGGRTMWSKRSVCVDLITKVILYVEIIDTLLVPD